MDRIAELLQAVTDRDDAGAYRRGCIAALEAAGFTVTPNVSVPDRGDGRPGRIALAASQGGLEAGIELDRMTPRLKSVLKLRTRSWLRFIALRERGGIPREFPDVTVVYPPADLQP